MSKRELLVIRVIIKAIRMCDIETNLHNNLKNNHGQLERLIYIYIIYSKKFSNLQLIFQVLIT